MFRIIVTIFAVLAKGGAPAGHNWPNNTIELSISNKTKINLEFLLMPCIIKMVKLFVLFQ